MAIGAGPIRDFPSGRDYQEALQHTHLCFSHPDLKDAIPELDKLRQPRPISGNFASVFSLTNRTTGRRYAVKCFTRHVPDQETRYQAISRQLEALAPASLSQPWKMGFEYLPDAIQVGPGRFPVLKMEWVDGVTLSTWLDHHHRDSRSVDSVADRFAALATDLALHGIAHGDLQHGNLLVSQDGTLRLVDYDGMYVPALAGQGGTERGHRNYQSPTRGGDDFDSAVDRFSTWVIFLALKAVAADPGLWAQLHEPKGEYLLLTEDDFKNPSASPRFPALLSHPDRAVRDLADQVRYLAWQPLDSLPALMSPTTAPAAPPPPPHGQPSASSGALPGWMSHHLPPTASTPAAPPATPPSRFAGRRPGDTVAAVLMTVTAVSSLLSLAAGLVPYALPSASLTVLITWVARRSRDEVRLFRAYLRSLRQRRREISKPEKAAADLQRERLLLDAAEDRRKQQLPGQRQELLRQHQHNAATIERQKAQTLTDIDRRTAALDGELKAALNRATADERASFVQRELHRSRVADARLQGIGDKLKADLAACGIRSAADFTGIRLKNTTSGGYRNTTAVIVRSGGQEVNVKGIGEAKARALDAWRRQRAQAAESRCAVSLPPTQRRSIEADFNQQRMRLSDQRRATETEADRQLSLAAQRLQTAQAQLTADAEAAADQARRQREEFARRALRIQNAQSEYADLETAFTEARFIRRSLSHARYIRFALADR
ncbi:serine/threonine protein kinase/outer membrane murein-binding lipoprotein Lpp [Kitasatospora sp. MAA19]|uniref:protein kinase domain-containing protein n=1 Tax=Kitasatospora sp. MAA19 TaxID=3035090 RepID=UPI00247373FC|nr:AarF/UbiB family protein [Kitasatospora sp. MAA19]MDH6703343.1 serine/threonine protein kinase/outer membrane murein-binding lipoprotein Lpp [Kitasatospora sp. MAA19]